MGGFLSRVSLRIFEVLNEFFIGVASGAVGIVVLTSKGLFEANYARTAFVVLLTVGCLIYIFQTHEQIEPSADKIVFITGCDSGLGFSLAEHVSELGFTVVAGCMRLDSKGAKELKKISKIMLVELDITNNSSVNVAVETVSRYLEARGYTRLIVISSHCGLSSLPGLSVYGATKAGLLGWSEALRVELGKYGVHVISFVPGSFYQYSNIMAKHDESAIEMRTAFTAEQKKFYGDYFKRYNSYLSALCRQSPPVKIPDDMLYQQFNKVLLDVKPNPLYAPIPIKDYCLTKFMRLPQYSEEAALENALA
ncbi:short-chain dehydrogenase/reductase family 9c [Holotrichia oblita]|uniref:Short-chain dehydrogenase/reductase family 9c n=1 Tax=Holotrichia oblita TaxID=644536 RepID=A0ACB9TQA1_HOLOL|nr:short-chain dehydrogenase/reductase family 9c [Holotrichia oblita]